MFKTILLATDGSELSDQAVQAAVDFAKINGSKIVGLSVVETYGYLPMASLSGGVDFGAIDDALEEQAQEAVDKISVLARKESVEFEIHTMTGRSPSDGILQCAKDHNCDVIFMSSHGRTGLDKMLIGSVAQKVLTHSTLPVLIFKQPHDDAAGKQKKAERVSALSIGAIA
jgi:nucleotide-binding universal stress UspA family protein